MTKRILIDNRWPIGTGIHRVAQGYFEEKPEDVELIDVSPNIRIGHPISPWELTKSVRKVHRSGDIFFNPGFIPLVSNVIPSVVTIHDLTHIHYYSFIHKIYYERVLRPLYRKCDAIICVSNFTRNEFIEWSGIKEDRVFYVPNGLSKNFGSKVGYFSNPNSFILYPGNHREYKNLVNLIISFAKSKLHEDGFDLILTGKASKDIMEVVSKHKIENKVKFIGFVTDEDLAACYRQASCLAFVSRYEGFGLPLLEAMACDTPVVAAKSSSLIEVSGDAAILVSPDDTDEIAQALRTACLDTSVRNHLIAKGRERVKDFDISISGKMAWNVIKGIQ